MTKGIHLIDRAIALTDALIAFPTISTDSNLAMIAYLEMQLMEMGAVIEKTQDDTGTKANLFATIGPDIDGGIVLSGHTDVVPVEGQEWSSDPFEMVQRDGKLFGRGACDMKGFIACALAVGPVLAAGKLARPLHFAFTYDEETGCLGAGRMLAALRESGRRPAVCLIGEPTEMRVVEGHKGCVENTTRFTGLEGHGSVPSAGVNAVEYAVRYVSELMDIAEALKPRAPAQSRFEPPWTTVNIGALRGGVAHNVIPNIAEVEWEFRPVNEADKSFVYQRINQFTDEILLPQMQATFAEASIETENIGDVCGLEPMAHSEAVALAQQLTGGNSAHCVPFGTEAGLFQALGISTAICGPGSITEAHKPDEFVEISQMVKCLDMLLGLGSKLAEMPRSAQATGPLA